MTKKEVLLFELKKQLKEKKIKRSHIANELNVDASTVSRWLNGGGLFPLEKYLNVCEIAGFNGFKFDDKNEIINNVIGVLHQKHNAGSIDRELIEDCISITSEFLTKK